jgi:hypothetical protein
MTLEKVDPSFFCATFSKSCSNDPAQKEAPFLDQLIFETPSFHPI